MIKILTVFGTRPEAIKMCPVLKEMEKNPHINNVVCITGQHREMLSSVLKTFDITPDYDLDIMKNNQTLSMITNYVLTGIDEIITKINPKLILVHGDTTTAYAAALAGFYRNIIVGHVEAGLRTYNINAPFPEEFNRRSIDMISSLLFAPTDVARCNLLRENIQDDKIITTGNTVIDALRTTVRSSYLDENLEWACDSRLILLTAHRRESIGRPFHEIFASVRRIIETFPDVKVIYPIHMNPKVREIAITELGGVERIRIIEPLDVVDFHNYIANSYLVLTDSGGIQEEAPALNIPVLVLRDTTERPEGIKAGTIKLVGTNKEEIFEKTKELLTNMNEYEKMCNAINPYGDGHASERIVSEIVKRFK